MNNLKLNRLITNHKLSEIVFDFTNKVAKKLRSTCIEKNKAGIYFVKQDTLNDYLTWMFVGFQFSYLAFIFLVFQIKYDKTDYIHTTIVLMNFMGIGCCAIMSFAGLFKQNTIVELYNKAGKFEKTTRRSLKVKGNFN